LVVDQLSAVFRELPPRAIKIGMLYSAGIVQAVAAFLRKHAYGVPLTIDPVAVASIGTPLLEKSAVKPFLNKLLPLATLLTPNLQEAEVFVGSAIRDAKA